MKYLLTVTLLSLYGVSSVHAADTWASFQNGGAVSRSGSANVKLGDVAWATDLHGYGQSSPVVWADQVYVTTIEGDNKEQCHVCAYQLADGAEAWKYTLENATPQTNNSFVSRAAPTAVADADGIVCFFEGGNVVALTHDGQVRWQRNLVEDYGDVKARHGLSASVEQDADSVFVWVERSEDPYIVRLAKNTGETQWKSEGLGATSWASPRLVPVQDGQHLVLSAIGSLAGLDPETGEQLWRIDDIAGNSTPTPMPLGDGRFLIGATVGRGESKGGRAAASNGVVQISRADDGSWSADYLWRAKRATSSFGSPLVHRDVAFFVNRQGVVYGLDAEDGSELFAKRLQGSSWATPIGVGDQVFFFGRSGSVDVLSDIEGGQEITAWDELPKDPASEKPAESSERRSPYSGSVLYAATWCNDRVLLRRGDRLFAVGIKPQ